MTAADEELALARRYVRAWIGDAVTVDDIVEVVAPSVVVLWGIARRAEEVMCWWAERAEGSA